MAFKVSNLEELILPLRIQIGDIDATPTYSDETLHLILKNAVSSLMRRWNDRYFVDNDGIVQRSPIEPFEWSSPPVIQRKDWRAIILQSAIVIKGGKKFSESGNVASWRDEEISYSNVESARQRSSTLADDRAELESLLPSKKLARPISGRQYGWTRDWE